MLTLQQIEQLYPESLRPFKRGLLREYLQYKILEIIFASEYANKLSFLGGTALRIIYNNARFSEDIDFDNFDLSASEFDELAKKIEAGLEAEGLKTQVSTAGKDAYRCRVRFPDILFFNELSRHREEKIMIQVDTLAHHFSYEPDRKILNKFDVFSEIFVTPSDILLSQKIFAALNRRRAKGRDFYDIVFLLSFTKPNYEYLKTKLNTEDAISLRQEMLKRIKGIDFEALGRDVQPFLFNPKDVRKIEMFPEFIKQVDLG